MWLPIFTKWNPSTSLCGSIAWHIVPSLMCDGRGSCTRSPSTLSSLLSWSTRSNNSF